jgi:hypothetical protein
MNYRVNFQNLVYIERRLKPEFQFLDVVLQKKTAEI